MFTASRIVRGLHPSACCVVDDKMLLGDNYLDDYGMVIYLSKMSHIKIVPERVNLTTVWTPSVVTVGDPDVVPVYTDVSNRRITTPEPPAPLFP